MARKSPATASDEQRMALKVMAEGAFTAEAKHEGIAYLHASPTQSGLYRLFRAN